MLRFGGSWHPQRRRPAHHLQLPPPPKRHSPHSAAARGVFPSSLPAACPAPRISAPALLRLAERRGQDQVATHPGAAQLEAARFVTAHATAASAVSALPQTHAVGRLLAAPPTTVIAQIISSRHSARRPLENPRSRPRDSLARPHRPVAIRPRLLRPKTLCRAWQAQSTTKPDSSRCLAPVPGSFNYTGLCLRTPKAKDKRVVPGSFNP